VKHDRTLAWNFRILALQVTGSRRGSDIWNREFQTPSSQKSKRSRVIGSWRISAVDHVGDEASGIQRSGFQEVRNLSTVDLASHEIPKSERKNSRNIEGQLS
jgi:hypothetical protein